MRWFTKGRLIKGVTIANRVASKWGRGYD